MDEMVQQTAQTLPAVTELEYQPGGPAIVTSAGLEPYNNNNYY